MATAAQAFRRNPPPPPTATNFPPPPRRAATSARGAAFASAGGRSRPAPSSGAERYATFTKVGAQQARVDEEKARLDAMRGFRTMRNGQPQGFPVPPPPPRPTGHPTAPRPSKSFEQAQNGLSPGFPGMSRTASRKTAGFAPNTPGRGDEPKPASTSAYANYAQGQRPQASNPQSYFAAGDTPLSPHSPTMGKREPSTSPLRQTQSSASLHESSSRPQRPELERVSTRYATSGGEKTFVNGVGRSSSVRNSPVDRTWPDHEQDGFNRPHSHHASTARHHSASPKLRPASGLGDISSSESASSSEGEPELFASRPKAQLRPRRQKAGAGGYAFRHVAGDGASVPSQFPSNSHKHVHSPQDEYTAHYEYPPPPPRSDHASQRRFPDPQPFQSNGYPRMNGDKGHHARNPNSGDPKMHPNMYGPFHSFPGTWSEDWGFSPSRHRKSCPSLNGLPSWAVPSSVLPHRKQSAGKTPLETIREESHDKVQDWLSHSNSRFNQTLLSKANRVTPRSFAGAHEASHYPYLQPTSQSVSQENINATFSATDWDDKLNSGDEWFRPTESRERRSPSRTSRPRARSVGKARLASPQKGGKSEPIDLTGDSDVPNVPRVNVEGPGETTVKSPDQAFQPGKFSAEEWAAKLKDQTWSIPNSELNNSKLKTPKRLSKSSATRRPTLPSKVDLDVKKSGMPTNPMTLDAETAASPRRSRPASARATDAMDIDSSFSDTVPITTPTNDESHDVDQPAPQCTYPTQADVNLNNLANVAPFAPSSTGLKDLDDLSTTLPFESRPAPAVNLSRTILSSRRLNLPKPPRTVIPPSDIDTNKLSWERYIADMNAYFYDWNVFNKKMIEHFRSRQEQIDMSMASHWISMMGSGPSPDHMDGAKAGYATYMAWLEDDTQCREWWDVANEKHRICFEDLGKARAKAKAAAALVL